MNELISVVIPTYNRKDKLPACIAEQLQAELRDSRATLEDALGRPVHAFAYPYGLWNERCEAAVRAAGYRTACHTRTGWAMHDGDMLRVRRLTVFNRDSAGVFARKLAFASHDVGWPQVLRYGARRVWARASGHR